MKAQGPERRHVRETNQIWIVSRHCQGGVTQQNEEVQDATYKSIGYASCLVRWLKGDIFSGVELIMEKDRELERFDGGKIKNMQGFVWGLKFYDVWEQWNQSIIELEAAESNTLWLEHRIFSILTLSQQQKPSKSQVSHSEHWEKALKTKHQRQPKHPASPPPETREQFHVQNYTVTKGWSYEIAFEKIFFIFNLYK